MTAPNYSAADFLRAFQDHLPTGAAWPRDADAAQTQFFAALVLQYVRLHGRSVNLLSDAFPVAPVELLPEWQKTLGLPDPCAGPSPTLQLEQQQVNARFIASGGQSRGYFVALAAALGYTITITEFAPSRFGQPFGAQFGGSAWAFAWQINAPTFTVERFTFGRDAFGEPFAQWGNTVLQCETRRLAPAHTTLFFNYGTGMAMVDEVGGEMFDEAGNLLDVAA
jgi:uncharacterized protein YmfQ (DUF2313 family)